MNLTYFDLCSDCGHSYVHHLSLLHGKYGQCNILNCTCKKVPPRYYVYDKDPTFIKDGLTLNHYQISCKKDVDVEAFVELVVKKLNS